jgi:superfamily II DNA or RNA helicase
MRPVTDLERRVAPFKVVSDYQPSGDQPAAIDEITKRIDGGVKDVVLLGATGTGKTATVAWVAEQVQRPVLVLQPNKTLAAQLRLLPARGVRPPDRHLHREGLLDQRGGGAAAALGDQQPAHPP